MSEAVGVYGGLGFLVFPFLLLIGIIVYIWLFSEKDDDLDELFKE
jgi:hypothetical protein